MVQGMTISEKVIRCAFEVSNNLGAGFLESVYENALCLELAHQGVEFEQQKAVNVHYRENVVGKYIADLLVENKLLIELKAVSQFSRQHDAQLMNYLRATGISVGLLLNFGTPRLGIRRLVWQYNESERI